MKDLITSQFITTPYRLFLLCHISQRFNIKNGIEELNLSSVCYAIVCVCVCVCVCAQYMSSPADVFSSLSLFPLQSAHVCFLAHAYTPSPIKTFTTMDDNRACQEGTTKDCTRGQ